MAPPPLSQPGVAALVRDVVDGLGGLVGGHLKLARAELAADARGYGRLAVRVSIAASLLLLGYGLLCVAAALALTRAVSPPVAFLVIGGVHVVAAAVGLRVFLTRTARPPLGATLSELNQTVTALTERTASDAEA